MWQSLIENKLQELAQKEQLCERAYDSTLAFVDSLMLWGKVYNLTALHTAEDITTRLVMPSLACLPFLKPYHKILDLGAGSGVPGALLAGVCRDKSFICVERVAKKVAFLRQHKASLDLYNSQIVAEDFTLLPVDPGVDVIISRGSAPLHRQRVLAQSWLDQGVVLMSIQTTQSLQQQQGDLLSDAVMYELDENLGLKLVVISS